MKIASGDFTEAVLYRAAELERSGSQIDTEIGHLVLPSLLGGIGVTDDVIPELIDTAAGKLSLFSTVGQQRAAAVAKTVLATLAQGPRG